MLALARMGASEGSWLRAEQQIAGRGREGRPWVSAPGNLYASTLVRLRSTDPAPTGLSLVAGLVASEVISNLVSTYRLVMPKFDNGALDDPWPPAERTAVDFGVVLKWPNDVLLRGAKVAGILLERSGDAVVVGLGVNVTSSPAGLGRPVTCLLQHGVLIEAEPLLRQIASAFKLFVQLWREEGLEPIRRAWVAAAHPVGTSLIVKSPDGTASVGTFDGLAADGALVLRLADDTTRVIHAGDVLLHE